MTHIDAPLTAIKRPSILTRAARIGARLYDRKRDLRAVLPGMNGPRRAIDIFNRLLHVEGEQEALRQTRSAAYSPARHVHILAALLAEGGALSGAMPGVRA